MRNEKSGGRSGKGYYIALVLCAAAIGITSYVTRPSKDKQPDTPPLLQAESAETASSQQTQALEALATEAPEESPVPSSAPQQTQPEKLRTAPPLSGSVTTLYAMDSLSYNETTRDWRVHNGVDYPGELGDPVSAAADGTVISIREDDSLGTTVVLRHTGGYETTYQNLEETVPVRLGDKVVLGQTIGSVGATALTESAIGPHVHFSVAYQDMPMDPADFLNMA
mgnify:FL=1